MVAIIKIPYCRAAACRVSVRVAKERRSANLSVPADRSFVQIDIYLLGFKIYFDAPRTKFAAKSRLLVAAPRRFYISRLHVIHPHDARSQRLHRAHGFENVSSPDGGGQPVGRVVRDLQRVFFVVERNHNRNRTEDFFARDAGAVIDVVEDSRLHIVAFGELIGTPAARGHLGFFLADLEIRTHAIVLLFRDQRSHLRFPLERRTDLDLFRFLSHGVDKPAVNRFLHQNAAAGRADFSLIDKDSEQRSIDGGFEIGIGKKDVRRLAAQFERHALHGVGSFFHDDLADSGRARKGNLVHVRMLDQRRAAGLAETGDHVHHALRQSDFVEPLREFKRGERRLLRWLEHAGATRSQCRSQFPRSHHQRVIPRDDLPGDAHRFFQRKAHRVIGNGVDVADDLGRQPAIIFKASSYVIDVVFRLNNRLARIATFEFGKHGQVLTHLFGQAEENASAVLRRSRRPRTFFKRSLGSRNRAVHVVRIRVGNLCDHFLGRRIVYRKALSRLTSDPLAINQHRKSLDIGCNSTRHKSSTNYVAPDAFVRGASVARRLSLSPQFVESPLDWTDEGARPYVDLAVPRFSGSTPAACGSFSRPYTKKKNAASARKNTVKPNIFASYLQTEVICLAGKNANAMPSAVVTKPQNPETINVARL